MLIRRAELEDAPQIAEVHVSTWQTAYAGIVPDETLASLSLEARTAQWQRSINNDRNLNEVALVGEEIVGFAVSGPERDQVMQYDSEIYALYILQAHQGKGIGKALVQSAMKELRDRGFQTMLIWVLEDNRPARAFYERMGGVLIEETLTFHVGGIELAEIAYGYDLDNIPG